MICRIGGTKDRRGLSCHGVSLDLESTSLFAPSNFFFSQERDIWSSANAVDSLQIERSCENATNLSVLSSLPP